ncbi:hypothetical protein CDIK_3033 [Cucumispora dikerogammari]|nr:hypothetical protein CDIK_3033 [Cucumispora dikerogammari]
MISNTGRINWKIVSGAYNTKLLITFLQDSLDKNLFTDRTVFIDNVRFYKSLLTTNFLNTKTIAHKFFPLYSLELNTIEEVFSAFKNCYYNVRSRPRNFDEVVLTIKNVIV